MQNDACGCGHPRLSAALVLLLALAAGLPSLWTRDLLVSDEVRLTEGARQLVQAPGGWLARVNGQAVVTEAPLPYWAASLLWRAGAGAASARLLSVLAGVAVVLVCFGAAARAGGVARGRLAGAVALTTMAVFWPMRQGGAQLLGALLLTACLLAGRRAADSRDGGSAGWWAACGSAAALGVFAVGLSVLLLAALVLGLYVLVARKRLPSPVSLLAGLAVPAGAVILWHAAVAGAPAADGLAWRLLTRDLAGLRASLREGDLHRAVLSTAGAFLPWIVIVPGAFVAAVRARRSDDGDLPLFAAVWLAALAVPAVLGGREGAPDYAAAAVPALAILCAWVLAPCGDPAPVGTAQRRLVRSALVLSAVFMGGILLLGFFHLAGGTYLILGQRYVCPVTDQPYSPYALALVLPFVAGCLAVIAAILRTPIERRARQAWLMVAAVFFLGIAADLFLTPVMDAYRSARPFAEKVAQSVGPDDRLFLYRKDYDGLYNLLTGRSEIPVIETESRLVEALTHPGTFVIVEGKRLKRIRGGERLRESAVIEGLVGGRRMLLLGSGWLMQGLASVPAGSAPQREGQREPPER